MMKRKIKDWLLILASLADDAAVVVLVLIMLWLFKITITWPIIIFLILLFIGSILIIHYLVIPVLHNKKIDGLEGMVGLEGKVIEPLNPTGLIKARGEYWKARTSGDYISTGETVEISGFDGLVLMVKPHRVM
jgi:membrane protein implicated in regulation of membrane protease activity